MIFLLLLLPNPSSAAPNLPNTLLWGTYRPQTYIGVRTRAGPGLLAGVAWYNPNLAPYGPPPQQFIRDACEHGPNAGMGPYGWLEHDGTTFGMENITDPTSGVNLSVTWRSIPGNGTKGGDWVLHVSGTPTESVTLPLNISFVFYLAVEQGSLSLPDFPRNVHRDVFARGSAPSVGEFAVYVPQSASERMSSDHLHVKKQKDLSQTHVFVSSRKEPWKAASTIFSDLEGGSRVLLQSAKHPVVRAYPETDPQRQEEAPEVVIDPFIPTLSDRDLSSKGEGSHIIFVQQFLQAGHRDSVMEFDVVFLSAEGKGAKAMKKRQVRQAAKALQKEHPNAVEALSSAFHDRFDATFGTTSQVAKAAFSNLIGSHGFFRGATRLPQNKHRRTMTLFTGVPSRSYFPRGFFWDEGFHQLIVQQWDPLITLEVMESWYKHQDETGWIPRELILGAEAESRVPSEFIVQRPTVANPPTMLLALNRLYQGLPEETEDPEDPLGSSERRSFELRLSGLVDQAVKHFQWFVNSQQSPEIDGKRWFMWKDHTRGHILGSGLDDYPRPGPDRAGIEGHVDLCSWIVMGSRTLQMIPHSPGPVDEWLEEVETRALKQLDELHWDEECGCWGDWTNSTQRRVYRGYVSIMPVLLGVVEPGDERAERAIQLMLDEDHLWSPFGVRSLSKSEKRFWRKGEDYWRGRVWINMNFLAVEALETLGKKDEAAVLKKALKRIVERGYERGGFLFEHYDPERRGVGGGVHPFTGWSALYVLLDGVRG